jgi:glycosyltransferase involved in cell wall biosynthesis
MEQLVASDRVRATYSVKTLVSSLEFSHLPALVGASFRLMRWSEILVKILHVTPAFYPAHVYGGPIESVYQLCRQLVRNGCEVRVLTTNANGSHKILDVQKGEPVEVVQDLYVHYCQRIIPHSVSPELLRRLLPYIRWADVVHLTSVYSFPTIPTLLACKILDKPLIWSPRGAFQRWEGSTRIQVKTVWEWGCRMGAPKQLLLHVTSKEEAQESQEHFPGAKTAIIPNGVEIPEAVAHKDGNSTLRLLFLGRLHPKKGIENLLAACKILDSSSQIPWSLTIAGSGDRDYTETLEARLEELALSQKVQMVGLVVEEAKQRVYENADIAIFPSYTENFGIVIAEALAHSVPVIASKGTPWNRVEEIRCGLWVDNHPESLAKAIEQISQMPLREMGHRGREWMQREFGWSIRAKEMIQYYEQAMVSEVAHAV